MSIVTGSQGGAGDEAIQLKFEPLAPHSLKHTGRLCVEASDGAAETGGEAG